MKHWYIVLELGQNTRKHVNKIYDFKNGSVKPECLQEGGGKTTTTINLGVVFRLLSQLCCNIGMIKTHFHEKKMVLL